MRDEGVRGEGDGESLSGLSRSSGLIGLWGTGRDAREERDWRDERKLLVYLVGGAKKAETISGFGGSYEL